MKYLARIWTSKETSYTMDIFLEEKHYIEDVPLMTRLLQHAVISNEVQRNRAIIKVEFFSAMPNAVWEKT